MLPCFVRSGGLFRGECELAQHTQPAGPAGKRAAHEAVATFTKTQQRKACSQAHPAEDRAGPGVFPAGRHLADRAGHGPGWHRGDQHHHCP